MLIVTRLDRSTRDLLNTLATITNRKAGFRSLGDTWAGTTKAHGRLMLTVLAGLAGMISAKRLGMQSMMASPGRNAAFYAAIRSATKAANIPSQIAKVELNMRLKRTARVDC